MSRLRIGYSTIDRGYESVYLALLKVTFSFRSPTAQETFMNVHMRSTETTRSQVDIQVAPGWEPHAQAVRGWLGGTSSACV